MSRGSACEALSLIPDFHQEPFDLMDVSESTGEYDLDLSFPTLPSTFHKVQEFVASGRTDPEPLIDIIERDPSVSVNVLRRANSAYYGIQREIERVDQAVRLLGFIEVSAIVMIEGMSEMRDHFDAHPHLLHRIVHEAAFTGRFAQQLTQRLELPEEWTQRAFPAGFIFSMGRLVLLHSAPSDYATLVEGGSVPLPKAGDEQALFGVNHRTLAAQACAEWDLSEPICSVLEVAADLEEPSEPPLNTLSVAIQAGISLAHRDLARREPLTPESLPGIGTGDNRDVIEGAANYASDYATEVARF